MATRTVAAAFSHAGEYYEKGDVVDSTSAVVSSHSSKFVALDLPEVPATPNAQDIADALVELGLVTQAA
jgi:hypothetical protein